MSYEEKVIWKTYPEFPFIEANQFGEVRAKYRTVIGKNGRKYHYKGYILKQYRDRYGYMSVHFKVNKKTINRRVHKIVADCFIPNPNNLPEINHINCDKTDNRLDNLERCTSEYNIAYREKYGKSRNRPVVAINSETGEVLWFESQREAARQFVFGSSSVGAVVNGKQTKTHGVWFCRADDTAVEKIRSKFGDKVAKKVEKLISENKKF